VSTADPLPGNHGPADAVPASYRDDIRACTAFREVAEALSEGRDFDAVLHLIAEKLSFLTGADRCSIHLVDKETGLLHGRAAHAPTDIDAQVKQLVSGTIQDSFTREILSTRRPVALLNTMSDPRSIKSAMRRWNARSVLGVPMVLRDEVIGVVYLDSENTPIEFSAADQELAVAFADLGATAIRLTQLTTRLRSSLSTVATQVEQLRQAASLEEQLTEIVLKGSNLREIGDTVARLLGKPCAIYDSAFRRRVLSHPVPSAQNFTPKLLDKDLREAPSVRETLAQLKPGTPTVIQPLPWLGLHHRLLICAVLLDGECWGYVVVAEHGRRLSPLDEAVVRRAALNIALERSGERRAGTVQWHTIEAFTGSLLRGDESVTALEERAEVLGLRLDVPRVVCLVAARQKDTALHVSPQMLARRLTDRESPSAVMAAPVGNDIALILELPEGADRRRGVAWATNRVRAALTGTLSEGAVNVAISTVVHAPGEDSRAYNEARQVLSCMHHHLGIPGNQFLTVDELGAGRLLLSSTDPTDALRYAHDALGPLLASDSGKTRELLTTLSVFLDAGWNVRRAARLLGVHANTIRYRTARIEQLTGLDVATDAHAQLTAQLALLILRMNGVLPPISVQPGTDDPAETSGEDETDDPDLDAE